MRLILALILFLVVGCATTSPPVNHEGEDEHLSWEEIKEKYGIEE